MRGYIHYTRPAGAAIAAVLALTSTYSQAQEAPAVVTPPADMVEAPAPAAAAPPATAPAPAFTPSQPMVQPTQSVDDRIAAARAASEAEAEAQNSGTKKAAPVRQVTQAPAREPQETVRTAAPTAAPSASVPANPAPAPQRSSAPVAQPVAPVAPDAQVAPAAAQESAGSTDQAMLWAAGGAALLLMGLGGAAMLRRRRAQQTPYGDEIVSAVVEPAPPVERPIAPLTAAAVSPNATLEEMVAAPPSADNPFRTYKKRMARAKFLARQQQREATAPVARESVWTPAPAAPAPASQTVYRFGPVSARQTGFKPQTR